MSAGRSREDFGVKKSNFKIRKYNRGRKMVEIVERAEEDQKSTTMKFILVPDRGQEILLSIIASWY